MSNLTIKTADVFQPLLTPARYKGAHGGCGSGRSHFFAEMLVEDHVRFPGLRSVCIREVQKSLRDSAKRLIEDKIRSLGVDHLFAVQADRSMRSAPEIFAEMTLTIATLRAREEECLQNGETRWLGFSTFRNCRACCAGKLG